MTWVISFKAGGNLDLPGLVIINKVIYGGDDDPLNKQIRCG